MIPGGSRVMAAERFFACERLRVNLDMLAVPGINIIGPLARERVRLT